MMLSMTHMTCAIAFTFLLFLIIQVLGTKPYSSRNKNTPFECGFDPKDSARLPFSMRFFLLAVIFLIFDIEVALLFPVILSLKMKMIKSSILASSLFLIILMLGLIHEWKEGSLSWIK
uniref:NADH-ubiquinone oxidoreductase chain 3 n=1 Tax=Bugula neritina TaxID=10212 RepID=A0A1B0QWM0_BUGNE|nr:NADH dehydrogenase subunit 3 [Bugula neritina]